LNQTGVVFKVNVPARVPVPKTLTPLTIFIDPPVLMVTFPAETYKNNHLYLYQTIVPSKQQYHLKEGTTPLDQQDPRVNSVIVVVQYQPLQ
jgi:hypothetical protein